MSEVTNSELFRVFGRIGVTSFGGPAAQIALMHRALVDERQWLSEKDFLSALSFCMLLPGPEAMQLATFAGWRLRGTLGGMIAGLLFVLPGGLVIALLALGYSTWGNMPAMQAIFMGIKATVIVIVVQALAKVSRKALTSRSAWAIATLCFIGIFLFDVPFPVIILLAAAWGFMSVKSSDSIAVKRPSNTKTASTIVIWGGLWSLPIVALWLLDHEFLLQIALFFSQLAVVTFGGAYAVLAYMTQQVVIDHQWLTTPEMIDALGLAETTPGPLILVTQFVGMLAGVKAEGIWLGLLAGAITLWVTFIPCFLWIFTGAPYIAWLSSLPRLSSSLASISAAVVGVMLNLSVWFALHVFFSEIRTVSFGIGSASVPVLESFQSIPAALCIVTGLLLLLLRFSVLSTLTIMGALGWLISIL